MKLDDCSKCNLSVIFAPKELYDTQVESFTKRTESERDLGRIEHAEMVVENPAADTFDSLLQERRILDDMKRATEDNELIRAIAESQREAEERRMLNDIKREAEDAALARAIKESQTEARLSQSSGTECRYINFVASDFPRTQIESAPGKL